MRRRTGKRQSKNMRASLRQRLSGLRLASPSITYGRYVALMLKEIDDTQADEYKKISEAFVRYSEVDAKVIEWHFADLAPLLFEFCLLGKHNG